MPKRLITNARQHLSRKARMLQSALEGASDAKRQAEAARSAAEAARIDAHRAKNEADTARASLERQQADFQKWVQQVAHLQGWVTRVPLQGRRLSAYSPSSAS